MTIYSHIYIYIWPLTLISTGWVLYIFVRGGSIPGMMLSQYTADTQIVDQRILSTPASVQSIPAAADQEDFVSMGMQGPFMMPSSCYMEPLKGAYRKI